MSSCVGFHSVWIFESFFRLHIDSIPWIFICGLTRLSQFLARSRDEIWITSLEALPIEIFSFRVPANWPVETRTFDVFSWTHTRWTSNSFDGFDEVKNRRLGWILHTYWTMDTSIIREEIRRLEPKNPRLRLVLWDTRSFAGFKRKRC